LTDRTASNDKYRLFAASRTRVPIKYVQSDIGSMAAFGANGPANKSLEELRELMPELSDDELRMMMSKGAAKPGKDTLKAEVGEGHESFEAMNLKKEIEKLKGDIERLKKDNSSLRAESSSWEQRFNDTRMALKDSEDALDDITKRYSQAISRIDGLEKELASRPKSPTKAEENDEIASLRGQLSDARTGMDRLTTENTGLTDRVREQESAIVSLKAEIEALRVRGSAEPAEDDGEQKAERIGKVTLASAIRFESELFEYDVYRVTIDRTGERISFRPDIEGKCPCMNGAIEIPMLTKYVKFDKPASYCAYSSDGKAIFIKL